MDGDWIFVHSDEEGKLCRVQYAELCVSHALPTMARTRAYLMSFAVFGTGRL